MAQKVTNEEMASGMLRGGFAAIFTIFLQWINVVEDGFWPAATIILIFTLALSLINQLWKEVK